MKTIYVVTGANGHLGRVIVKQLFDNNLDVRGLLLPNTPIPPYLDGKCKFFFGDVRDYTSLIPLVAVEPSTRIFFIHTAGLIDIANKISPHLYDINVTGVKNIIKLCLDYSVTKLIHISSVHALKEAEHGKTIFEQTSFSPDLVTGGYAKTKAIATQMVLDSVKNEKLCATILLPAGIIGPMDDGTNKTITAIRSFIKGKLRFIPPGGYNFVDVRDVARACIRAIDFGQSGESYILAGTYLKMKNILEIASTYYGNNRKGITIPTWIARLYISLQDYLSKKRGVEPSLTHYGLDVLKSNGNFSHEKAKNTLDFNPRDIHKTIADTVAWIKDRDQ